MNEFERSITEKLFSIQERIVLAAQSSGRDPANVRLVVVTKGHPVDVIRAAIHAGAFIFGENYPEQAQPKILALKDEHAVEWHMIGHLQSRKAKIVVEHFSMLHSLDSVVLADKLNSLLAASGKTLPVLLEFNVAGEESKTGWKADVETGWGTLLPEVERVLSLDHLRVCGLMTMPPIFDDPERARPFFTRLGKLRDFLSKFYPKADWRNLSMGTSIDFEVAVQEGATYVRVGTAILGPRPAKQV